MSSAGNLATGAYTQKAVEMAGQYDDFVIGFICQRKLTDNPQFLHMTPGVQIKHGKDALGQQFNTPQHVIENGSDIIIVGRGIYAAKDPKAEAALYKNEGWQAYTRRVSTN
jgi:orotidine 5'-phosphate decarboxylase subfamily 1